jgi:hypothetical protein
MLTFKALLALLGVSIFSYMVSMIIMIAAMTASRAANTTLSFSMAVQIFMMIPATLVLLGFAGAWQSRFGQKLARRWRTGAES